MLESENQPADPGARRLAVVVVLCGTVAGAVLIWFLTPTERVYVPAVNAAGAASVAHLLAALSVLLVTPIVGCALYFWWLGSKTIRAARFPPSGVRMIRDTRVLRGDAARVRGRVFKGLALAFGAAALALTLAMIRLALLVPAA